MKTYAVIGANFGDEGKGLMVDYLTRRLYGEDGELPFVARGNGGAQAGHTVVTSTGKRHVFGHISSGHFAGAPTYLGKNFIVNPYLLEKETKQLGDDPSLYINSRCRVTTIFDMAINSLMELSRGTSRHGSCGMGINETATRHDAGFRITMADVMFDDHLPDLLKSIYKEWWFPRAAPLIVQLLNCPEAQQFIDILGNDDFVHHAQKFAPLTNHFDEQAIDNAFNCRNLIVEGAQGLALDEFIGKYPHVTRSVTGLPSAIVVAAELNYDEIIPVYVTRAYHTRHGAGPLRGEGLQNENIPADATNVTGPWQQDFRYAPLDIGALSYLINRDLARSNPVAQAHNIKIAKPRIALTCMDHIVDDYVRVILDPPADQYRVDTISKDALADEIGRNVRHPVMFMSAGPTAEDVKEVF